MKKFYTHNGKSQQGPFDIDELKQQGITKSSMVWYEGLDNWVKAADVLELKKLFAVPPPFIKEAVPPPIDKASYIEQEVYSEKQKNKSSWGVGKVIGVSLTVCLVFFIGIIVLGNINVDTDSSFLKLTVNPPNPVVVSENAGDDPSSNIFNYRAGVDATILNQGGVGSVLVTCTLHQGSKQFERSQELYMSENQTQKVHFTFDEAVLLGDDMTYKLVAKGIE